MKPPVVEVPVERLKFRPTDEGAVPPTALKKTDSAAPKEGEA